MNITIVYPGIIPVKFYGGTQRVIWYLGQELVKLGHKVTFLVEEGSQSDFADVKVIDKTKAITSQIPENTDVVHFQYEPKDITDVKVPYVITMHGNRNDKTPFDKNTIFVSKNHASRYGSDSFVHNGLDWNDYSKPTLKKENYVHFLGNAAWRLKNVKGAINVATEANQKIKILGGKRFNFKMGIRFTFTPKASFYGMVGGQEKYDLLDKSKGLIFPIRWHEPFGLAITESLFYGCPVFGTPYGSLPELVTEEVGFLSANKSELVNAVKNINEYSNKKCHDYAIEYFNSKTMALSYLKKYEQVVEGKSLNDKNPVLKNIQTDKFLDWN